MVVVEVLAPPTARGVGAAYVAGELPVHRHHVHRLDHLLEGRGRDAMGLEQDARAPRAQRARQLEHRLGLQQRLSSGETRERMRRQL